MSNGSIACRNIHFLKKEIPLSVVILMMLATAVAVHYFFPRSPEVVVINSKTNNCPEKLDELRLKDYKFTHPLMLADVPAENQELNGLKEKITNLIADDK